MKYYTLNEEEFGILESLIKDDLKSSVYAIGNNMSCAPKEFDSLIEDVESTNVVIKNIERFLNHVKEKE